MNITPEQAQSVIVLLVDRAPKNTAELIGAQAALEKWTADIKELAGLKAPKEDKHP